MPVVPLAPVVARAIAPDVPRRALLLVGLHCGVGAGDRDDDAAGRQDGEGARGEE